jgi:hypothetical protein
MRPAAISACAFAAACGAGAPDDAAPPADTGPCFVAFGTQIEGFRTWTSAAYDFDGVLVPGGHVVGRRIEYLNKTPPHGSTTFPVGTIFVKEIGLDYPQSYHLFAMVKRGCGYNASGAVGWEWMELKEVATGVAIEWRGVGPPNTADGGYLGAGTCNFCHAGSCADNDSVCSTRFRLKSD